MTPEPAGVQVDLENVISHLEQRLGAAMGQIARLEAAVGGLVKQMAEADNTPAPVKP